MIQIGFSRPMKDRKRGIVTHSSALKSARQLLNFRVSERKTESQNGRKKEGAVISKQATVWDSHLDPKQWIGFSQRKKERKKVDPFEKMHTEISILKRFEQIELPAKLLMEYKKQHYTWTSVGRHEFSACYQGRTCQNWPWLGNRECTG